MFYDQVLYRAPPPAGYFSGIGFVDTGVSELNPELSEELVRLRRQNEQLAAKVRGEKIWWWF